MMQHDDHVRTYRFCAWHEQHIRDWRIWLLRKRIAESRARLGLE